MNTETERPEPLKHTFTITVDVDPQWVSYITQHSDIFGRPYYAGYWACGVAHDLELGWLVYEHGDEGCQDETENWYRLDRAAALRMWEEGVKRFGVGVVRELLESPPPVKRKR
jgi:hypothetical protein